LHNRNSGRTLRKDRLEVGGHRRSLAIGEEYAKRLLALIKNPNQKEIAEKLVWAYPSHDFAVDFDEALAIGLPVVRLDRAQDDALIDGLREVMHHEITFYGFIDRPSGRKAPKSAASKAKKATPKGKPVQPAALVAGTQRLAS